MFWSKYGIFPSYYLQNVYPYHSPWSIQPQQVKIEQQEHEHKIYHEKIIENKWINLTRQDLLNEGYERTKRIWTKEEDKLLKNLIKKYDKNWVEIAKFIPDRNQKMCYGRFRRLQCTTKNQWKDYENQTILSLVNHIGMDWKEISLHLQKRTPKQIKEHYLNYLHPSITNDQWTLENDLLLIDLLNQYGPKWKLIKEKMNNRSENQIKNRFFGKLKRILQKKESSIKKQDEKVSHSN